MINKLKEEFPDNYEINNILEKLIKIEDEERILAEKKQEKIKKKKEKMLAQRMNELKKSKNKYMGTLSQTFKDSQKYKNIDDKEFFNTRNFINNNYNTSQGFYNSSNNNKFNLNNINQNNLNDFQNNDYNKLDEKELLLKELLNKYQLGLNNKLYELIENEEKQEKERLKLYHNTSINKKEDVKKQLEKERMESIEKINKLIEENNLKLKEFENELKKKYN